LKKKFITEDEQKSCAGCLVTSVNQMSSLLGLHKV